MRTYCQERGCKHLCRRGRKWCRPCLAKALRGCDLGLRLRVHFDDLYSRPLSAALKAWKPGGSSLFGMEPSDYDRWTGDMYKVPVRFGLEVP